MSTVSNRVLLVFLEVPVVGQGQALQDHEQAHEMARHPAAFAPDELRDVGVLFLGHDGGPGGIGIGQRHEPELRGGPEDELFRQAAQMHHDDTGMGGKFQEKIPVAHRVQAVSEDPGKTELGGHRRRVDGKGGAGQGRSPQGRDLDAAAGIHAGARWSRRHISS